MKTQRNIPSRRQRKGFTLVEALLALAITALLMTALASAVYTTMKNYTENDQIAASTQVARAVFQRMLKEIRTSAAVSVNGSTITIIPADANVAQQIAYRYDAGAKQLYYDKTVGGVTTPSAACGDNGTLTQFIVSTVTGQDWQGQSCLTSITVTMTLKVGDEAFVFTASAAPRRNQTF